MTERTRMSQPPVFTERVNPTIQSLFCRIRDGYTLCNLANTSPFYWPEGKNYGPRTSLDKYWWRSITWFINGSLTLVTALFVGLRSHQVIPDPTIKTQWKIYMLFTLVFYWYAFGLQVANFVNCWQLPLFVNKYMTWMSRCGGDLRTPLKMTRVCYDFLKLIRRFVHVVPILGGCLALVRPASPEFWSSLHPCPMSLTWTQRLPLALLQSYLMFLLCDVGLLWVFSTFPFLFFTLDVLDDLRKSLTNKIDEVGEVLKSYAQIRILMEHGNQVWRILFSITKCAFIIGGIFCTYGSLRTPGIIALFLFIVGAFVQVFLAILLVLLGEINSRSRKFLANVGKQVAHIQASPESSRCGKVLRKEFKSQLELRVRNGSAYFVDKPIVVTVFTITLENTINLLIMQ